MLVRITGPTFCGGIEIKGEKCVFTCPYLRGIMLHKSRKKIKELCTMKGWKYEEIPDRNNDNDLIDFLFM